MPDNKDTNDNQQPPLSKPDKGKVGRPKITYTPDIIAEIDRLALLNCTDTTIATVLGIKIDRFRRDFAQRTNKKRGEFRIGLRQAQLALLADKNPAITIFLGKNDLGQTDKIDTKITGDCKVVITK